MRSKNAVKKQSDCGLTAAIRPGRQVLPVPAPAPPPGADAAAADPAAAADAAAAGEPAAAAAERMEGVQFRLSCSVSCLTAG